MKKDYLIEKYLRQTGLEMKDVYNFYSKNETPNEILHQRLTSYILFDLGIKRSRILSSFLISFPATLCTNKLLSSS